MIRTPAQKIADALICLSILALITEAFLLPWINAFAYFQANVAGGPTLEHLMAVFAYDFDDGLGNLLRISLESWGHAHSAVLALFLWLVSICGAVILIQGIRILATVADGTPFSPKNAVSLRRAGEACFVIAAALASYTALLVPLFAMAGLLCLVMSALFRQAAEIKAENDLTI